MVGSLKSITLAGVLVLAAAPAFAQNLDPFGIGAALGTATSPLGAVDLDPLHIFTPAPPPPPPPAPAPMMRMRHHHHYHTPGHYARKHAYRHGF